MLAAALPAALSQRDKLDDLAVVPGIIRPYWPVIRRCTADSHAALKEMPRTWEALPLVGTQVLPAEPEWDIAEERLELRQCPCGSTLTKRAA